jgi:hypothetical protein
MFPSQSKRRFQCTSPFDLQVKAFGPQYRLTSPSVIRISHLNEDYLVGKPEVVYWDGCTIKDPENVPIDNNGVPLKFSIFNDPQTCAITFPFCSADAIAKEPGHDINEQTFGLLPLVLERIYQRIITGDHQVGTWAQGDTWETHAANTRQFFSVITNLPLVIHKVSELGDEKVEEVLRSGKDSPVYLVTPDSFSMVTSSDSNAKIWRGYDLKFIATPKYWTLDKLRPAGSDTYLIYSENHGSLKDVKDWNCPKDKVVLVVERN